MANLNVKEEFWIDVIDVAARMGDQDLAIGNAIRWFRYAQSKHKDNLLVSEEDFRIKKFSEALFPNFAERTDDGIRAVGAKKYFDWLTTKAEAGAMGGKKSAARPRDANGRLRSYSDDEFARDLAEPSKHQASTKQNQAESNEIKNESCLEENNQATKHHQAISISNSISIPFTDSSSSKKEAQSSTKRESASTAECGPIPEFSGFAPHALSVLNFVSKRLQTAWDETFESRRDLRRVIEKTVTKNLGKISNNDQWERVINSWVWNEKPALKLRRNLAAATSVDAQITQVEAYQIFEANLKKNGVKSFVDLLPKQKGAHREKD